MPDDFTEINIFNTGAIEMYLVIVRQGLDLLRQTSLRPVALVHERR
jgi:hypothetical protein